MGKRLMIIDERKIQNYKMSDTVTEISTHVTVIM